MTSVRNDGGAHQCRVCTKLHGNTSSHNTRNDLRIGGTSLAVGANLTTMQPAAQTLGRCVASHRARIT